MNRLKQKVENEKRRYLRLAHVYPVEFAFCNLQGQLISSWQQGFTCNISQGGICLNAQASSLVVDHLKEEKERYLRLKISIPLFSPPVEAFSKVAWMAQQTESYPRGFLIGLQFLEIQKSQARRMLRYARIIKRTPLVMAAFICILFTFLAGHTYMNYRLRISNEELVQQFVFLQSDQTKNQNRLKTIQGEKTLLAETINDYNADIRDLKRGLDRALGEINRKTQNQKVLRDQANQLTRTIAELQTRIQLLESEKAPLANQLEILVKNEEMIQDRLRLMERNKRDLENEIVAQMIQWLKNHQNQSTGLISSFEGPVGIIKHWAFIYDQALAANVFLIDNDLKACKKILNFFARKMQNDFNGFHNAYYSDTEDIAEFTIHSGPNIWAGMAIAQYADQTGDRQYLPLAQKIADWLIALQEQDKDGGLRGGPDVFWYATEHNLDAYAFLDMMAKLTGEEKYYLAQKKILSWLEKHAMVAHENDHRKPPVKRGRGDATIATDTFAWSLAAIGPPVLRQLQMDPEAIMAFAEKHCKVQTRFRRPSGVVIDVEGFDFSKPAHVARGGILSPEWTSQMIVSFQILADDFQKENDLTKTVFYRQKAVHYLNELNKLIISSPSPRGLGEGCLPYATVPQADTGHGWRTPKGTDTGSIAGTAYMIMAIYGYNPLELGG